VIEGLKPHSKYSDSGVPWLGALPSHWRQSPGMAFLRERHAKNAGMIERTVLSLSYGRIVVKPRERLHGLVPDSFETYQVVDPGDIIIRPTDLQNDWNSKRVGLVRARGIITSAYLCLRSRGGLTPEFAYEMLQTFDSLKVFYGLGSGLRQNLDFRDFKRMVVFVPPPEEQAAIVRFLDHVGGRIERAIRAKRKVIALLQEQQRAIIQRAVTRGLTQGVPLEEASAPWLGSFPAHWELRRMSSLATFISGKAHEHFVDPCGEHICVTAKFVSTGGASGRRCTKNLSPARKGDVLMVMSDLPNGRALARAYLVEDDASYAVNQRVCILRPQGAVDSEFLVFAADRNPGLLRHDDGSNQTHLSNGDFKTLPIQCPPRAEQKAIVASVRPATAAIAKRLDLVAREIGLLQEFRTRLIADVVTGKLDVREAASKLPAEPRDAVEPSADLSDEPIDEEVLVE
jgi:type I restriction enzyme S subunit